MMAERALLIDHTTIYRWVMAYLPEINKRCRKHLWSTNDLWKVDKTYNRESRVYAGKPFVLLLTATRGRSSRSIENQNISMALLIVKVRPALLHELVN